jgi:mono/diheme cytochrome c family protein
MLCRRRWILWTATVLFAGRVGVVMLEARQAPAPPTVLANGLPARATGEEIFRFACATCHGADGTGAPESVVGFALPLPNGHDFPDFTDCPTNTVEPMADWVAVATRGGPIRALDRHMPAFGEALTADQIEQAVRYLWTFCTDGSWPRG